MLYDITPAVSPGLAVWPGDTPLTRDILLDLARGDSVTLSTLRATVHLGAHADAPNHYAMNAPDIASRSLEYYLGPCEVMRVRPDRGATVTPAGGDPSAIERMPGKNDSAMRRVITCGS